VSPGWNVEQLRGGLADRFDQPAGTFLVRAHDFLHLLVKCGGRQPELALEYFRNVSAQRGLQRRFPD